LSNGLIGIRCGQVPLIEGVAIVSGLAGVFPGDRVEGFARAPYPVAGDVSVDGRSLKSYPHGVRLIEQRYDFSCGELTTRLRFQAGGPAADIEVLTFCSRTLPTLVLQEVRVTVDADCRLELTAAVDPEGIGGRWLERDANPVGPKGMVVDGALRWETHGGLSRCGAAYLTRFEGAGDVERRLEPNDELAPLRTTYGFKATPGTRYMLRQITSLVASSMNREPDRQAARMAIMGALRGFDLIRHENRDAWNQIWKGRVKLCGAGARWQRLADAAFYYLHASAHASSLFSTSMFGLAYWPNYHYYRGQVMWDIETFAFPTLLLTTPETAAALLDFRFRGADAARRNAAMNGYLGLQYPWAAGPLSGEEAIRTSAELVTVEQHVNMSVAHAFAQYVCVTGDHAYLREQAWPVVAGVAAWIVSRLVSSGRGYEFKQTLGFAEGRKAPVDNDAYVNMAAIVVLREAADFADRLDRPEGSRWRAAAERIVVPIKDGVILNHDRFTAAEAGLAGATPEALGGLFPYGYEVPPDVEEKTIRFYLGRVEPYLGSPMFCAPLGVFAARIGDRELAARLFEQGYAEYVNEPWLDTNEFSVVRQPERPVVGPMFANLGGFLTSCLFGLTGMKPSLGEPETWFQRPVVMPEGWEGVEVDQVWIRGRPARLAAFQGDRRGRVEFSQKPALPNEPRPSAG
jgi:protein-glucosylgalactosylhydroxylysine glucosidase